MGQEDLWSHDGKNWKFIDTGNVPCRDCVPTNLEPRTRTKPSYLTGS